MALHFSPSSFRGRIMVGSRKSDAQSLYQVACYPVPEMDGYLKKMKQVMETFRKRREAMPFMSCSFTITNIWSSRGLYAQIQP